MHWRAVSKYLLIIAMFDQLRAPCQIQYSKYFRSFQIKFTWCYSGLKIKIIIFLQHHSKYICQVPLKFIRCFAGNMQISISCQNALITKKIFNCLQSSFHQLLVESFRTSSWFDWMFDAKQNELFQRWMMLCFCCVLYEEKPRLIVRCKSFMIISRLTNTSDWETNCFVYYDWV